MFGIVSYGAYIPKRRVSVAEIAQFWGRDGEALAAGLGVWEKAVASVDEDAVTLAVEAATNALICGNINSHDLEVLLIGSESHPYVVKPSSTIVGEILGIGNNYLAADLEFACKAGSASLQLIAGLVESKRVKLGMGIGSDVAQAKPSDILESTAGSGAAAFVVGRENLIAKILGFTSYSSDTPDFWRRDGEKYPSHGGRFTGEPAYFTHVMGASKKLLSEMKMAPADFDYAVFHMPNGKFPKEVAKRLGFSIDQIQPGLVVEQIGNPYSGSSLLGLCATLDNAKAGDKIFMCSYGSGAGSDAFVFEVTPLIGEFNVKCQMPNVKSQIENKISINYPEIAKDILKGARK